EIKILSMFREILVDQNRGGLKKPFYLNFIGTEFRYNHRNYDLYKKQLFILRINLIYILNFLKF
ncbi:MAG: hypothetical protein CMF63_01575, partial [Magnetovibrio sp.]|nr:hypothetical protein [Magnetovibrio sp.]